MTTSSSPRSAPAGSSANIAPHPRSAPAHRAAPVHRPRRRLRIPSPSGTAGPEALSFYLDQRRVHVGDLTALTEDVFAAWQADQGSGLDAIMLAPTRELVGQLNQRARAQRLATEPKQNLGGSLAVGDAG